MEPRELGANDRNVSRSRRAHEHDLWALNEIDLWAGNILFAFEVYDVAGGLELLKPRR